MNKINDEHIKWPNNFQNDLPIYQYIILAIGQPFVLAMVKCYSISIPQSGPEVQSYYIDIYI